MKSRRYSLSRQIWLMMMLAAVIFALVFGGVIYYVGSREGENHMMAQHRQIAAEPELIYWLDARSDTAHYLVDNTPEAWQTFLQSVQVPGRHGWQRPGRTLAKLELNETMQGARWEERHNTHWLITYLPERDQYLISAFYPSLRRVILPILGLTAIVILLGFAHSAMVLRLVIKPVHQLAIYADDIAAKRWRQPMDSASSAEEIGELIEAMNDMQIQLQRNEAEQQTFLQSISHDLKTPVAVIMAHAQAIQDGVYVGSPENNAAVILEEARRLEDKIRKVLYYNTLDYSLSSGGGETTAVAELLEDLAARFGTMESKVSWQLALQAGEAAADEENLRVALENILDNALRYAHSIICLANTIQEGWVTITIANDGEPIAPRQLERIFDQLSKGSNGNFGLGLFISRKIIKHYGGQITAENTADGVTFIITLPAAGRNIK